MHLVIKFPFKRVVDHLYTLWFSIDFIFITYSLHTNIDYIFIAFTLHMYCVSCIVYKYILYIYFVYILLVLDYFMKELTL